MNDPVEQTVTAKLGTEERYRNKEVHKYDRGRLSHRLLLSNDSRHFLIAEGMLGLVEDFPGIREVETILPFLRTPLKHTAQALSHVVRLARYQFHPVYA